MKILMLPRHRFRATVLAGILLIPGTTTAAVFICAQPDGSDLYTDTEGPGCQAVAIKPFVPPISHDASLPSQSSNIMMYPPSASKGKNPVLNRMPFQPAKTKVPTLNYYGGRGTNYVPKAGEISFDEITVQHLPNGTGPAIVTDAVLDESAARSLNVAVSVAAHGIGYDPAYLEIKFEPLIPTIYRQLSAAPFKLFGNSGSAMWSIGIAAALLGDNLRPDACMTGSIEEDAGIGTVGKVDQKIFGCAKDRYREMIVPYGQKDADLVRNAIGLGITVTEARTFAEAYEFVTGKSLRHLPQR
jgi:hypothetical protein